jgi:hypothetical protein
VTHEEIIALLSDRFGVDPDGIRYGDGMYRVYRGEDKDGRPEVALYIGWRLYLERGGAQIWIGVSDDAGSVSRAIGRIEAMFDAYQNWKPEGATKP